MKSIKKYMCIFFTTILLASVTIPVMANDNITVKIDGQQIAFDVQPQIINSRTMVPLRAIFEALGATVDWNSETQTVTSTKNNTTISLTINSPTMYVNGMAVTLDSPACIIVDRTLVPVRAISEAFGTNVDWDGSTSTVIINTPVHSSTHPKSSLTLKKEEVEVKVKPSGDMLIFENKSSYPCTLNGAVVNGEIVVNVSDVIINPGERKQVYCELIRKGANNGLNSYGYVVITWQNEQYYMDFTVNGITEFYKGNRNGPAE